MANLETWKLIRILLRPEGTKKVWLKMMKFTPIVMDLKQRVHITIDRVKRIAHCRYTVTNVPKTWVKLAIRVIWWAFFLDNHSKLILLEWFVKWIGGIHRDNYWLQKGNHMAWVGFNWPFDTFHWLCKSRKSWFIGFSQGALNEESVQNYESQLSWVTLLYANSRQNSQSEVCFVSLWSALGL